MRNFQLTFYGIFCLSFALKFFHVHYNAVLMLIGLGGILVTSIIAMFRKESRTNALLHLALFAWLVQLLVTIKFFPFDNTALIIAAVLSVPAIATILKRQQFAHFIPLVLCASMALYFYFMRTDNRYYLLNVKWNYEIEYDYITLDKYSWFLYKNGEINKALEVSDQALEMARKSEQQEQVQIIEQHNQAIQNNDWKIYR
jgi:hypothetical protein